VTVATMTGAISDAELRSWTPEQRAALARRLARLGTTSAASPAGRPRRRVVLFATTAALCLGLLVWASRLAANLPSRYVTGHWDVAWVGFDLMIAAGLAATGLAVWRGSLAAPGIALATSVMLVCDAWFDVSTANGTADLVTSLLSAALVELPLAACGIALAYRLKVAGADGGVRR